MPAQYLDEYARELRRDGEKAFRKRHGQPVLIVTKAEKDGASPSSASVEVAVVADTSGWRLPAASLVGRVFVVSRGAFVDPGPVTLGRTDGTELTIADKSVSKKHCVFEPAAGGLRITDLGSTNGTSVDGEPLPPNVPRALAGGETIDIGNFELVYQTADGFVAYLRARPEG
ncbi:MAG TPA: FHA domain-containing protein [Polyangia bacterium]|nr:FHA domain-containing protein [Polyangia bacterium]